MNLSAEEVLEVIVRSNKVDDMLRLIEQEKKSMVEVYRRNRQDKLRLC